MKITVVVPTYWTSPSYSNIEKISIFDHPTSLDSEGTLLRALESFKSIGFDKYDILVISACTNPEISFDVEKNVQRIIDRLDVDLRINHFSYTKLEALKRRLLDLGQDKILGNINLDSYANIRNLQLLIPYIIGSEVVVAIDDDEIIVDENYLDRAVKYVGKMYCNNFVGGIGGYYLDENGCHKLKIENCDLLKNIFDGKACIMNQTYEFLDAESSELVKAPLVFGGNMVIPRSTFERVPFDPYITRGEDIDYLINAKMQGIDFYFDKGLNVIHLPPENNDSLKLSKLKQDILRFLYEKEKIHFYNSTSSSYLDIREFMPYPGIFLQKDITEDAKEALIELGLSESEANDFIAFAKQRAKTLSFKYFDFQPLWQNTLKALKNDERVKQIIKEASTGGY